MIKIKDYSSTTYITGMRAFAALGVLLIHAGGAGLRSLGLLGNCLADLGRGGVYAFFVISGFSVAASYERVGGYKRYLFMRFMRLAPLYYFWMLVYLVVLGRNAAWSMSPVLPGLPLDLFLHLTFLHAFYIPTANSFIGVEWSLSVEMFWYLWLPSMLWLARRQRGLILMGASLLSYFLLHFIYIFCERAGRLDGTIKPFFLWDPLVYFLSYALGVWAFVLRGGVREQDRRPGVLFALFLLAFYVSSPLWAGTSTITMVLPVSVVTFLFLLYGTNEDPLCKTLFLSKPVLVLGTLSYGIYLSHLLMVDLLSGSFNADALGYFLQFLGVAILSVAAAWAAYALVEQPAERWAKRFYPLVNKSNF